MKQDGSQSCLKPSNIPLFYGLCRGEMDSLRRGPKEIKSQTRIILETIDTLLSILYNPNVKTIYIIMKE